MNASSTQQVVLLNNGAAALFETENYDEAVSMLKQAFAMNKSLVLVKKETSRSNNNNNVLHKCCTSTVPDDTMTGDDDSSEDYIYRKPITIAVTSAINAGYDIHVTLSAIIIFNLALAHHLSGMFLKYDANRNSENLEKAVTLYSLALQVVVAEQRRLASDVTMFLLAIFNNIGHIHKTLGETKVANSFFERMLITLLYLSECQGWEGSKSLSECFFRNTTHLILKDLFTAEAA
jgi:tetratricopeptide (TPR) repeat protein